MFNLKKLKKVGKRFEKSFKELFDNFRLDCFVKEERKEKCIA